MLRRLAPAVLISKTKPGKLKLNQKSQKRLIQSENSIHFIVQRSPDEMLAAGQKRRKQKAVAGITFNYHFHDIKYIK